MSFSVRDVQFDVAIVAGPRIQVWPSAGVRALSAFFAEMGLSVGIIGGDELRARGVVSLPGTGGLIFADDLQKRIHRFQARAVIRFTARREMPYPFLGWLSPGLIPLTTALQLKEDSQILWHPRVVILGSGNRAFKFGSALLKKGVPEVISIETVGGWGLKNHASWEVEKRLFESLGGKFFEGRPLSLKSLSPLMWELRVQVGSEQLAYSVSRVVSAGPFRPVTDLMEYPPGSLLFEMEQIAPRDRNEDFEGWALEEEQSKWLGVKVAKALVTELGPRRHELQRVYRKSKNGLKACEQHQKFPFQPHYQGKWIEPSDSKKIRTFSGVPQQAQRLRLVASIECFENIPCDLCVKSCPESAIAMSFDGKKQLVEGDCTACGICLSACPSDSIVLIHEKENLSTSIITFYWNGHPLWKVGNFPVLVNRRGESLESGRVVEVVEPKAGEQLVQVEVPTHLVWEARGLRLAVSGEVSIEAGSAIWVGEGIEGKVEINLDGERRFVREGISVAMALFETGRNRPEESLLCGDGSCGLCAVLVDGIKKPSCQTQIRKGMAIRLPEVSLKNSVPEKNLLCSCLGISCEDVSEKIRQGKLASPEAVLSAIRVGGGRCHGQLCMESFKSVLEEMGIEVSHWIDWRFPWADWQLTPGAHD